MSETATTKRSARQAMGPFGHVGRAVDGTKKRDRKIPVAIRTTNE